MGQKNSANKSNQHDDENQDHSTADGHESEENENQDRKSPAVSANYRDIILECFGKASSDTAARILMRIAQQRSDFKVYKDNLTHDQLDYLTHLLSKYLCEVIENIGDVETVKQLSMDYGSQHVSLRLSGFKVDFFAAMADAIATECSFLSESATAHAPTSTFKAWTLLVGLMFSSVRDGFYKELRRQRRQSPSYLKSSRESSTSLEYLVGCPDTKQKDSVISDLENSRSGSEHTDNDKTITASSNSPCKLTSFAASTIERISHRSGSLDEDRRSVPRTGDQRADISKRPKFYQKSKSTTSFGLSLSSPVPRSKDESYHHSHIERLKHSMKARTPSAGRTDGPLIGRFLKNPTALVDNEAKRCHRIEQIIKHHSPKSKNSTQATTPPFDPNKIIDDFMHDRYKV